VVDSGEFLFYVVAVVVGAVGGLALVAGFCLVNVEVEDEVVLVVGFLVEVVAGVVAGADVSDEAVFLGVAVVDRFVAKAADYVFGGVG